MMITPEMYFGDPQNPYDLPEAPAEHILALNFRQRCAHEVIEYMYAFPSEVKTETVGNKYDIRTLDIKCSAPFDTWSGLFVNGSTPMAGNEIQSVGRMEVVIQIGDLAVNDEIIQRWINLRRADGKKFGVPGVSRRTGEHEFEQWQGLSMRMRLVDDEPSAELWAIADEADSVYATLLTQKSDSYFGSHYESLVRALSRKRRKRLSDE